MRLFFALPILFVVACTGGQHPSEPSLPDATLRQLYERAAVLVEDQLGEKLHSLPPLKIESVSKDLGFPANADYGFVANTTRFFRESFIANYKQAFGNELSGLEDAALIVLAHELVHAYQDEKGILANFGSSSDFAAQVDNLNASAMNESQAVFIQSRVAQAIGASNIHEKGVQAFKRVIEGLASQAGATNAKLMLYFISFRYVDGPELYQTWFNKAAGSVKSRLNAQFKYPFPGTPEFAQYKATGIKYLLSKGIKL